MAYQENFMASNAKDVAIETLPSLLVITLGYRSSEWLLRFKVGLLFVALQLLKRYFFRLEIINYHEYQLMTQVGIIFVTTLPFMTAFLSEGKPVTFSLCMLMVGMAYGFYWEYEKEFCSLALKHAPSSPESTKVLKETIIEQLSNQKIGVPNTLFKSLHVEAGDESEPRLRPRTSEELLTRDRSKEDEVRDRVATVAANVNANTKHLNLDATNAPKSDLKGSASGGEGPVLDLKPSKPMLIVPKSLQNSVQSQNPKISEKEFGSNASEATGGGVTNDGLTPLISDLRAEDLQSGDGRPSRLFSKQNIKEDRKSQVSEMSSSAFIDMNFNFAERHRYSYYPVTTEEPPPKIIQPMYVGYGVMTPSTKPTKVFSQRSTLVGSGNQSMSVNLMKLSKDLRDYLGTGTTGKMAPSVPSVQTIETNRRAESVPS